MITCQKCRALLEPGTKECPYCQTDQRHQLAPSESEDADRTTRFGLWILGVIVGIYVLTVLLDPARGDREAGSFRPSHEALVMFGAADGRLVSGCGQYWRLLASMFLHADLLHLILNSVVLVYLIPVAAGAFGVHRTALLYLVSGFLGGALTLRPDAMAIGASGALCGLIGACAAYGRRRGGIFGDMLLRRMISWAVLIAILGIGWNRFGNSSQIDNLGHLGGFLAGGALGWLAAAVRARGGATDRAWALAAKLAVVVTLLVAAVFWAPFALRSFERREVELYRSQLDRALRSVSSVIAGEEAADQLPATLPDGPGGSEGARDAVRRAVELARSRDSLAPAALDEAEQALDEWSETLFCTYAIAVPLTEPE